MRCSRLLRALALPLFVAFAGAHPMGNFSVSHYSKLVPGPKGAKLEYVLDLAEIPTFELLQQWKLDRNAPPKEIHGKVEEQASEWLDHLIITVNGRKVHPILERTTQVIADGAANLPIIRITMMARIAGTGKLEYEDRNYPDRAGWKEIVIDPDRGVMLQRGSQSNADVSKALTAYPPDPTLAPPQDLRAQVDWSPNVPSTVSRLIRRPPSAGPVITPIAQPTAAPAASSPALMTRRAAPKGSVVRGDFLSRLLHQRTLTAWMILTALGASFLLGGMHALTPGHGKTIVAAYLVGSRGTLKHAAFLGAMVTFTHTVTVFALGLATLFLFRYIVPEKITQVLGAISGLSIVAVGAWMLRKRIGRPHGHRHDHHHDHAHERHHHDHHGDHTHGGHSHTHSHDQAHTHAHMPDEVSWGALVTLGASGGLVPCESALLLLLGSIALGRVGLGLILLVSFSLGLALALMSIGVLVLYAKNLIPERKRDESHPVLRWASVLSPIAVIVIGMLMTGVSLGWIRPGWNVG